MERSGRSASSAFQERQCCHFSTLSHINLGAHTSQARDMGNAYFWPEEWRLIAGPARVLAGKFLRAAPIRIMSGFCHSQNSGAKLTILLRASSAV